MFLSRRKLDRMLATLMVPLMLASVLPFGVYRISRAQSGADSSATGDAQISDWASQLGSSKYSTRKRATEKLIAAGMSAIPAVVEAVFSNDREVRGRAFYCLERMAHSDHDSTRQMARLELDALSESTQVAIARRANNVKSQFAFRAAAKMERKGAKVSWDGDRVRAIRFSGRTITDDDLQPLRELSHLKQLDLRDTNITNAALKHITHLTSLELLNLRKTRVTDEGLQKLRRLTELRSISLEYAPVSDVGMQFLKPFHKLSTLYLGGSEVKGPGLQYLGHAPITYISFQYSRVDDSVAEHIEVLKHLKTLGLDDTQVSDACVAKLSSLKKLEVLWLNRSNVTDACIPHVGKLTKLKTLHLTKTNLTAAGFAEIRRTLKHVRIVGAAQK